MLLKCFLSSKGPGIPDIGSGGHGGDSTLPWQPYSNVKKVRMSRPPMSFRKIIVGAALSNLKSRYSTTVEGCSLPVVGSHVNP
jgi:hypothetical protein